MNDKYSENGFEQAFDELFEQPVPPADPKLKKSGINAAAKAFSEQFAQGTATAARPIGNRDTDQSVTWLSRITKPIRSLFMNIPNNRMAYNAFGTAAVAFVAVSLVYMMPSMQSETRIAEVVDAISERSFEKDQLSEPSQSEIANSQNEITNIGRTLNADDNAQAPATNRPDAKQETSAALHKQALEARSAAQGQRKRKQEDKRDTPASSEQLDAAEAPSGAIAAAPKQNPAQPERLRARDEEAIVTGQVTKSVVTPVAQNTPAESDAAVARQKSASLKGFANGSAELQSSILPTSVQDAGITTGMVPSPAAYSGGINADLAIPAARPDEREEYAAYQANPIHFVVDDPVSTFSIDVDTASYSLVRNQLNSGYLPKPQAVRAEELINYFDYDYPVPRSSKQPFKSSVTVLDSPWNQGKKLVHIGIKGYDIPADETPDSNLVFLLDVSGSMNTANKLSLVKQSIGLLLDTLKPTDTVSIAVYAGAAGTVLEPTPVREKSKIIAALQKLHAGGSTAGGAGIKLAYQLAEQNFNKNAVNRIILATDGDFNVGQQSNEDLKTLIERKRDSGVYLSVLGFGRNNYQDDMMQTLAQNGNGVAAYIDTLSEAKKVLVDEATSTLFPIAKDVKIQVEFNPATVSEYRLVGYETRHLNREDFNNDKVDAGDIGAGHSVTAIYEITPAGSDNKSIDEPRYAQNRSAVVATGQGNEYGFLKIRYKLPNESKSRLVETAIARDSSGDNREAQFSVAVAGFAQLLTGSKYTGSLGYDDVVALATSNKGGDPFGYRSEFIQLVRMAKIARP